MKKALVVFVALLAMVAFVTVAVAQEKKAEPPAAGEKAKAEKPKAKAKAPAAKKFSGAVTGYEAGKTIKVKGKKDEMAFDLAPDAKIKGDVKEGAKVTVSYKKEGEKNLATAVNVAPVKKKAEKKEKKAEEKKPAEKK